MTDQNTQPKDLKTGIFENFLRQYQALISFVQGLPLDPNHKSIAIQQFYLGFLSAREGIALINFDEQANGTTEGKEEVIN